jgi:hypothetical protein
MSKACQHCARTFDAAHQQSKDARKRARARHAFKQQRYCSTSCANAANGMFVEHDPDALCVSAAVAAQRARRICPKAPCAHCGETRRSEVEFVNGNRRDVRPGNLRRRCQWCRVLQGTHAERSAATQRGWDTRRRAAWAL